MTSVKSLLKAILPASVTTRLTLVRHLMTSDAVSNQNLTGALLSHLSVENGLVTNFVGGFMEDARFQEAYNAGKKTGGLSHHPGDIHWRAYAACWAANKAMTLEGDFVECGVNLGFLSRTIVEYTRFETSPKRFYLLDTFAGFPYDTLDTEHARSLNPDVAAQFRECFEDVRASFAKFPNVILVRGKVPETLKQIESDRIAYLSIDMNNAAAEIAAAEYLWDRMVNGSVIVLDDYGHPSSVVHRQKFNDFCRKRNVQVLTLAQGQGLIFKHQ